MKKSAVTPEVVYATETWKADQFTSQLVNLKRPSASLDRPGRILFYHTMAMEAGKISIAAALMTALELHKAKLEHPSEFVAWCEANLRHGNIKLGMSTAYRYLTVLNKTIGRNVSIDELAQDTEQGKLEAVATFTKYTNYQSLYQLYHEEGIVKPSNLGGGGRGQGRKRKEELSSAAGAAEAAENAGFAAQNALELIGKVYEAGVIRQGFEAMDKSALKNAVESLKLALAEATKILKAK